MAKRRTSLTTRRLLKVVLIALLAILGIVTVYMLAGATDGMLAGLSAPLKAVVVVSVVALVWTGRRFFARDLAEADLARVRAAARRSDGSDVSAASIPARTIASVAPDKPTSTGDTTTAHRTPGDTTALATYLAARNALVDIIASIDTPLTTTREADTPQSPAIKSAVKDSASSLARSTADLYEAARQIADVCELLTERMEVDLLDRQAFAAALMELAQRASPSAPTGPQPRARSASAPSAPPNGDLILRGRATASASLA